MPMAITTTDDFGLLRLMQLSSASLPVGGYSFSQGMEYAIDDGWIKTQAQTAGWLQSQLQYSLARLDLPCIFRLYEALLAGDIAAVDEWNNFLLAARETHELRLTDTAMGNALQRLLVSQNVPVPAVPAVAENEYSFVTLFCAAAHTWQVDAERCALGFCWSWLENQVAAATKLVPLGQTQAQTLLGELQVLIPAAIDTAKNLADDELGSGLPALAIASSLHETQYSRLFRS